MSRTVLVTSFTPVRSSGTGLRTCGIVDALVHHGPVEVRYVPFGADAPDPGLVAHPQVTLRPLTVGRGPRRALAVARALRRGVPRDLARAASSELVAAARSAPQGARVVVDGPTTAGALLGLARRRPLTYLAHNLESGFRQHVPGSAQLKALERFERTVLSTYAESWLPTRADVAEARGMAGPAAVVRYVPNVVDVDAIEPVGEPGADRLLFVGDFTYPPNAEAREWLLDEVLPLVWARRPETTLVLVGRGSQDAGPLPPDRVEALGFVDDLGAVYRSAGAVAVPLLHGGGSPLKFVEALAYGQVVVATAHATRLLEEGTAGTHFLSADDAAGFAEQVVRALSGRAPRGMGAAARALAEDAYSTRRLAKLVA